MTRPKRIVLCYTDTGGGHRATARALQAILQRGTRHEVILCDLYRELIADRDLFRRFTGFGGEDIYNRFIMGKNWPSLYCRIFYALILVNIRMGTRNAIPHVTAHWRNVAPDLVISVMPLVNSGLYQTVQAYSGKRPVPFMVVMTDLAELMRRVWFPLEQDYYIVCGADAAYEKIRTKPHMEQLVFRTSGLLVHPSFYEHSVQDPAGERKKLGLRPDWPTGCMMYGATGSPRMIALALALRDIGRKVQMIFLCGHNQSLADELQQMNLPYPHLISTYVHDVPYYFALSDVLVCKPGPGTISEACVTGLPLLLDRQNMLPQERFNIKWAREHQLGQSFGNPSEFIHAFRTLLEKSVTGGVATRSRQPENRAIFDMPDIIRHVLDGCEAP